MKLLILSISFSFVINCLNAQLYIEPKSLIGFSKPINAGSYLNDDTETLGILSYGGTLAVLFKKNRSNYICQIGFVSLGFQGNYLWGFTPTDEFPFSAKDNRPIKTFYVAKLDCFDAALGYGYDVSSKIQANFIFHYLIEITSRYNARYRFPSPDYKNSRGTYRYSVDYNLNQRNEAFKNSAAIEIDMRYFMTPQLSLSVAYLVGLNDYMPFENKKAILHQNISMGLAYRFRLSH